jgi:hypothetical protein
VPLHVCRQLVHAGEVLAADVAPCLPDHLLPARPGLAARLVVPGGDLLTGEHLGAGGAGVHHPSLYGGVSLLVQPQTVSPARAEGAVSKAAKDLDTNKTRELVVPDLLNY